VDERGKIAFLNGKYSVRDDADLGALLQALKGKPGGGS
jgi:hypothetical protein